MSTAADLLIGEFSRTLDERFRLSLPPELTRPLLAVGNTRGGISKKDMVHNTYLPKIEVNAETYEVRADGQLLVCEPAQSLPMAQRYFLF